MIQIFLPEDVMIHMDSTAQRKGTAINKLSFVIEAALFNFRLDRLRLIALRYFSIFISSISLRYGNDLTQGQRKTLTRVTHYQFYLSISSAM